jgi:hypothetical protein
VERIYNYIPEKHWEGFINHGFYLKPAVEFSDKLEVRYGSINRFLPKRSSAVENRFRLEWSRAVEEAFCNQELSKCLSSALVSCWTHESEARECMWYIYGHNGPAVRVGVDIRKLESRFGWQIGKLKSYGAMGDVQYGRKKRSLVRPMETGPKYRGAPEDLGLKNKDAFNTYLDDLFLKHNYYAFEREYRFTKFARKADQPEWIDPDESVVEIRFSPIKSCDADAWIERFRRRFPKADVS